MVLELSTRALSKSSSVRTIYVSFLNSRQNGTMDRRNRNFPATRPVDDPAPARTEHRALRFRIGNLANYLTRRFVLTNSEIDRVTQTSRAGPGGIFSFDHQFRPHPLDRAVDRVAGHQ